jgi:RNA polymerase sigma-70 factor (ECF subfamily)
VNAAPQSARQGADLDQLAAALRAGDRGAAAELVRALAPSMLGAARSVLGATHPDVEDALQEALVGLLEALPSFRGECGIKHFGCRIAARSALDARRRRWRSQRREQSFGEEQATRTASPDELAHRRRALLRRLVDELPEAQAETLVLRVLLGMSLQEVAEATSAPLNTVRSRLRLAKEALGRRIDRDPILCEELEVAG